LPTERYRTTGNRRSVLLQADGVAVFADHTEDSGTSQLDQRATLPTSG
jgi:hypothetical protein